MVPREILVCCKSVSTIYFKPRHRSWRLLGKKKGMDVRTMRKERTINQGYNSKRWQTTLLTFTLVETKRPYALGPRTVHISYFEYSPTPSTPSLSDRTLYDVSRFFRLHLRILREINFWCTTVAIRRSSTA